ncbi:DDB1- and CUL4-associated factor 5-like isoform X2 [Limulus polyphemus]|uniref:DDB1- and CUL4-associated factor 5-like isoform X2 n=1 Tax=Limulus polyphemus TaxID=6850 RepID=A0ABM1B5D0_LIMPO|nr:DDB1- and CUL4-associated factor 5-like isoform X2 [Limulus polyphemus]
MAKDECLFTYITQRQYTGNGSSLSAIPFPALRHRFNQAKNLYRKDLFAHYGCVNAIEFSHDGEWLASGGDDKRVLLWNVEKVMAGESKPQSMNAEHTSNIFCLGFDSKHSKLFSAGNDEQVIVHDPNTGETVKMFLHEDAVYGISIDPTNDCVFASACDDGRVLVWDIREGSTSDPFVLANYTSAFHAVMYNPVEPRLLATANSKEGIGLWDIRKPRTVLLRYGGSLSAQSAMSVRFNCSGTRLVALRRRLPPVICNLHSSYPVAEFDHPGYYNSCTMKSCCFGGDNDQYVLSGSDDFRLYVWKIPDDIEHKKSVWVNKAHLVLRGHRSIVNQVRYNTLRSLIVSSGVEKIIKLWSMFSLPDWLGSLENYGEISPRRVYSHEEYIDLILESGQFMTHDYSHQSVKEDPRMMAFFDSLVQRDIKGYTSDSSDQTTNTELLAACFELQSDSSNSKSSILLSSSLSSSSDEETQKDEGSYHTDGSLSPQTKFYLSTLASRAESTLTNLNDENEVWNDVNSDNSENPISQLIAHKRHDHFLRTARASLRKTKKRLRNISKSTKCSGTQPKDSITGKTSKTEQGHARARKVLDSVLQDVQKVLDKKDKRKKLRKRRARILQDLSDSDSSSDSNKESHPIIANLSGRESCCNKHTDNSSFSNALADVSSNHLSNTMYSVEGNSVLNNVNSALKLPTSTLDPSPLHCHENDLPLSHVETQQSTSKHCTGLSLQNTNSLLNLSEDIIQSSEEHPVCLNDHTNNKLENKEHHQDFSGSVNGVNKYEHNRISTEEPSHKYPCCVNGVNIQEASNSSQQHLVSFKRYEQSIHSTRKYRKRCSQEDDNAEENDL